MKTYQFAIIGGGLAGATAALALSRFGLPICLVEKRALCTELVFSPALETPTIALSYASKVFFEYLGIWAKIAPHTELITTVEITAKSHWGSTSLQQPAQRYPALGYVVDVAALQCVLNQALLQAKNVTIIAPAQLLQFAYQDGFWQCGLDNNHWFRARLLCSAEGAQSMMSRSLGISQHIHHYAHRAMMANVTLAASLAGKAIERFITAGVIALLPWKSQSATMVVSLPKQQMQTCASWTGQQWLRFCQDALGESTAKICALGSHKFVDLSLILAQQHFYKQLILLGNSVHSIHPIAAQGFNLSLRDIKRLYLSIQKCKQPEHWGLNIEDINQYVRTCQHDQQKIIAATHQIAHSVESIPSVIKAIGLLGIEYFPAFKQFFTKQAMGVA